MRAGRSFSFSAGQVLFTMAGVVLMLAGLALFLYRASTQLLYFEFGDESEKLVGAQLMAEGWRLYKDFFAHHGPLPYAIAQQYAQWVSPTDFTQIRWLNVGLVLAVALAIFLSPVFHTVAARSWATGLFVVMLSSVWLLIATHTVIYQALCGFLLAIIVVQLLLPALEGIPPGRAALTISGFLGTLVCFASYAYGPSVVLLVAASFMCCAQGRNQFPARYLRRFIVYVGLGALAGCVIMLGWLSQYGDLKGYWVYHFLFNQKVYAGFVDLDLFTALSQLKLEFDSKSLLHAVALTALCFGLLLTWRVGRMPWSMHGAASATTSGPATGAAMFPQPAALRLVALALLAGAILLLNPRGLTNVQDNPFVILSFVIFAVAFGAWATRISERGVPAALRCCLLGALAVIVTEQASDAATTYLAKVTKDEAPKYVARVQKLDVEPFSVLRELAPADGDLLGLIYNPVLYIVTDRLPASGHYYYLPWQAAYGRSPQPGYHIDLCADIQSRRPPVIWFDDWKVWDKYPISEYEPCVPELLSRLYARLEPAWPVFLLKSQLAMNPEALGMPTNRRASPELLADRAIALPRLHTGPLEARLKYIEILFGTHGRVNQGQAELRLYDTRGEATAVPFDLASVPDNRYVRFEVEPGRYAYGEIVALSGGGVSTWESEIEPGRYTPCARYAYDNGTFAFTPGCPVFTQ